MGPSIGPVFTVSNYTGGYKPYVIVDTHNDDGKRNFEYALIRDEKTGEATGVFRVPETNHFSVKMLPGKRWKKRLRWKRLDWHCLTDKELEEITEGQYESYIEFGVKEFKVRREATVVQSRRIALGFAAGAIGCFANSVMLWFDWYIAIPELVLATVAILAIGYSVGCVTMYRVRAQK